MSYYPTLAEDIERAKAILDRGRVDLDATLDTLIPATETQARETLRQVAGGTIVGADIYAAYKLLESFVEAIECIGVDVVKTALRAQAIARREASKP